MITIKAPNEYDVTYKYSIFLGGSIEMGKAEDWQTRLQNDLSDYSDQLVLLTPRRDNWDSSWRQDPTPGTKFHEQVSWELDAQFHDTDLVVYYFAPETKSPITLLELGMFGALDSYNTIVCCPKDFWRYGNVKMVCDRLNIRVTETYDEFLESIEERLSMRSVF